jgi:hypothetical protein
MIKKMAFHTFPYKTSSNFLSTSLILVNMFPFILWSVRVYFHVHKFNLPSIHFHTKVLVIPINKLLL